MIERCRNPNATGYQHYGGRGIRVCARWLSFEAFLADMGERPEGTTLDRREVNGHYEPGNCRWATRSMQSRNTRRKRMVAFRGEEIPLVDACNALGLRYVTVYSRLRRGQPFADAVADLLAPDGRNSYRD